MPRLGKLRVLMSRLTERWRDLGTGQRARFSSPGPNPGTPADSRALSAAHLEALRRCELGPKATWADRALCACLERLAVSTVTDAGSVKVLEARVETPDDFRIIFETPYLSVRAGLHGSRLKPLDPGVFPYPLGDGPVQDPTAYGKNVADFAIGEPFDRESLTPSPDSNGIFWYVL
jgi:hypothetical protein